MFSWYCQMSFYRATHSLCVTQYQKKAQAQKMNPEFTVVYTEARHHKNLVPTLFIYSLINWGLKPCTMLFKLKGISQVMQSF